MDSETISFLLELAKTAPATVVLAFVAWRLDNRLQGISERIDTVLNKLADAALAKD